MSRLSKLSLHSSVTALLLDSILSVVVLQHGHGGMDCHDALRREGLSCPRCRLCPLITFSPVRSIEVQVVAKAWHIRPSGRLISASDVIALSLSLRSRFRHPQRLSLLHPAPTEVPDTGRKGTQGQLSLLAAFPPMQDSVFPHLRPAPIIHNPNTHTPLAFYPASRAATLLLRHPV